MKKKIMTLFVLAFISLATLGSATASTVQEHRGHGHHHHHHHHHHDR